MRAIVIKLQWSRCIDMDKERLYTFKRIPSADKTNFINTIFADEFLKHNKDFQETLKSFNALFGVSKVEYCNTGVLTLTLAPFSPYERVEGIRLRNKLHNSLYDKLLKPKVYYNRNSVTVYKSKIHFLQRINSSIYGILIIAPLIKFLKWDGCYKNMTYAQLICACYKQALIQLHSELILDVHNYNIGCGSMLDDYLGAKRPMFKYNRSTGEYGFFDFVENIDIKNYTIMR